MRRFFIDPDQIHGDIVRFSPEETHHLRTVLRLKPGAAIELFDGAGQIYTAKLTSLDRHLVEATIYETRAVVAPTATPLSLAVAMLKGQKMDLVVQKATELGVTRLLPVRYRYTESGNNSKRKVRWQKIMREACKQCRRSHAMSIEDPVSLKQLVYEPAEHRFFAWERQGVSAEIELPVTSSILAVIGPEGGIHPDESKLLLAAGFAPVGLGPLILRAETAAIALCALLQHKCGNWNPREGGSAGKG
ncbi:MAG: 16S rRNA (uracil(1498)-N(3))-methyltransferase [Desulfobulbus propionicus]|nr:MAG: 16S rRNA (uracil(1498)-N(3))-methyltransferase [Desulfobulbus propionicus]